MRSAIHAAFAALFLIALPVSAQRPWEGAPLAGDPKAIAAAAEAVPAGEADAVVLLDELHYTFDDDGRATSSWRLVYRIVEESALDEWSTIGTEWAPWYQKRPEIAARVIAKDGSVHTLDPKAVTESAARDESPDIFSDNRLLRAPLPGMAAGVVVEQVITYRDDNPLFDTGVAGRLMFGRSVPVEKTRLVIDAPAGLAVRFVNKTAPKVEPVRSEAGGRQHIVIESARIEPFEDFEWYLPYDESSVPYVAFSTGTSWQDTAKRYSEIVEKQLGDPKAVEPFLRGAIGKSTDRREIVRKSLAAIQKNVRYAGVEVGEGSIVPRTPKEVLALKYGDCKDKATLLVAMLRAAGIPAHVALVNAGTDLDVDADLPGFGRFNHVIVRVGGDDPFWVDPTDEFSPAGVLPVTDQDRLALVADASTTHLTRTPAADSSANTTLETRTFLLPEEGKASIVEVTEATGSHEANNRRFAAQTEKSDYRESMEGYAKAAYEAEALKSYTTTDPRDLDKPFRITLDIDKAARGQTSDIDAAVAIFPSSLLESLPWPLRSQPEDEDEDEEEKPKKRTRDFVVAAPFVKELRYRIVPPPGYVARTLPPSETRRLGTTTLVTKYEVADDGAVLASLRFDSGKRRLTPAEVEETRKALSEVANANAVIVGFDSAGWARLNAGDIRGAIEEFRRLAALHPKEARHRVQVGRAYFVGGMAEASREELRRAIALEPTYAPAHRFLGIALQHDLLAREYRKGADLPGAIAAYRKARELAPKDVDVRSELAKILTRGDDGELFGKGARLDEAIAEYKSIAAELDDRRFEGELLTAMAHAGRFDEMKTYARTVQDETQRLTALVIAAAATEGSEAALREAASVDPNVRRGVLSGAAQTLLQLRLYPETATIFDHAVQGTPQAPQVRPFLDVLRRTKRAEQLQFGDDPKAVVMKLLLLASTATDLENLSREFMAPWVDEFEKRVDAEREKADIRRPKEDVLQRARNQARGAGLPIRVAAEIGFAAMDLSQEGDDATGHRVRLRAKIGVPSAPKISETYYVVRHEGRYLIAASNNGSVGITVLRFLEQNELDKARTWLNWAREEMSAGGGDDPLSGPPFASLWPKAKATATADEIRVAAAALLVTEPLYASATAPLLAAARETVAEPLRTHVDVALALAYMQLQAVDQLLPVARRLGEAAATSATAFRLHTTALAEAGQSAEAQRIAKERLEKQPNDIHALRALADAAAQGRDFAAAIEYGRTLIERTDAEAGDYNDIAWNALFTGSAFDQAIEYANHSVAQSGAAGAMHTLAALYAEAGNSLEARTKLLESMDAGGREEPTSIDWYVLGRIAENYGAKDAALAAYKRVTQPKWGLASSTYELAQRRVKLLGK